MTLSAPNTIHPTSNADLHAGEQTKTVRSMSRPDLSDIAAFWLGGPANRETALALADEWNAKSNPPSDPAALRAALAEAEMVK